MATAAVAREIIDSAGRKVEVPDRIERVMAAGPPASILLYMLAPEKMIGWSLKPRDDELPYLAPIVRDLPEIGRLTGRGNTANLETVMNAKPGIILDFGSVNTTYVSLADRVEKQTGIPYLLIDGRFENTAAALRLLGSVLGVEERAQRLAVRAEAILNEVAAVGRSIPEAQHPRVYLARRPNGLETGNRGSINTEIIERAGGVNVVEAGRDGGGLINVSLEQVIQWNPDTVITTDRNFAERVASTQAWANVAAVQVSPGLPQPEPALWLDRCSPVAQPDSRFAVARSAVLPGSIPDRYPRGNARVLQAILPCRAHGGADRSAARTGQMTWQVRPRATTSPSSDRTMER
jgi:iron complex transport system substrate-binding protein